MISESIKILVHRAIDGELSQSERGDFEQLLESSPDVRQFYTQLQALAALPGQLPPVDPPAELRNQILTGVANGQRRRKSLGSNPRSIGALIGTLLTPRLAYGLAAGLIVGIGVTAVTLNNHSGQLNPLDLSGTLTSGKDSKGLTRVDADSFGDGQAVGQIAVDAGSGLTYIQIALETTQEISLVLEFDPLAYTLRAFEQQSPISGEIASGHGLLRATHVGDNRYLFVLGTIGESKTPVVFRVESTGVIYRRELQL